MFQISGLPNSNVEARPWAPAEVFPPWRPTDENKLAILCSGMNKIFLEILPGQGSNFINILHRPFALLHWCQKFQSQNITRAKLGNVLSCKKIERKMLMKLTQDGKWWRYLMIWFCGFYYIGQQNGKKQIYKS